VYRKQRVSKKGKKFGCRKIRNKGEGTNFSVRQGGERRGRRVLEFYQTDKADEFRQEENGEKCENPEKILFSR